MRVIVSARRPADVQGDVLVQLFCPGATAADFSLAEHLAADADAVVNHEPAHLSWLEPRGTKARWAIAACVGPGSATGARIMGALIERAANDRALRVLVIAPAPPGIDALAVLEGLLMRVHACEEFVPDDEFTSVDKVVMCVTKGALSQARARIREVETLVEAASVARRLADLPANIGTPAEIVARTKKSLGSRALGVRSISETQARRMGMGLFAAVAAGGADGRILLLEHNADRATELPTLVLVGKGVVHDTGGYNLKASARLWEQSYDKAGASAVIGAMHAIADLAVEAHVVAIVPLCENAIGPEAMKPGDILTALDGTTVFVENTDAEGRLVLADCLVYARRYQPDLMVDIATLTHAVHVGLGDPYAGLFASDDSVRDLVLKASQWSGDAVWPLPIHPSHAEALRHTRAAMANASERAGGACIAAAFLEHFAEGAWAHIDMGGKGLAGSDRIDLREGATGFGARLLVRLAQLFAESDRA